MPPLIRLIFFLACCSIFIFFGLAGQRVNIATNLEDLNASALPDPGLKFATDRLAQEFSQRFLLVVKGDDELATIAALNTLRAQIETIDILQTLSDEDLREDYLSLLTPYRFNLLNTEQRQSLQIKTSDELALLAQRKLFQLGEGVRFIPFEQDPLAWFGDYILSLATAQASFQEGSDDEDSTVAPLFYYESIALAIREPSMTLPQQEQLYSQLIALEEQLATEYGVEVLHSGVFFFAVDSAQSAKSDIQLIAVGSALGVLGLMLLVFRSLLPLLLALGSIALGVGFAVVVSHLLFGSVHILTIVFGASLIGIVVDYSLHYFYHFLSFANLEQKSNLHDKQLKRAMLLSVITSLIGYGALGLSDLETLKKVAIFSCSGLLMAWLSVMVLGPMVVRRPIAARQGLLLAAIRGLREIFARRPKALAIVGVCLAVISGTFLLFNELDVNDDPRLFFNVSAQLLEEEQQVSEVFQLYEPGRYLVIKASSTEEVYNLLENFSSQAVRYDIQFSSMLDWLPSPTQQKKDYLLQEMLYADSGVLDLFAQNLGLPAEFFISVKEQYLLQKNKHLMPENLLESLPQVPSLWIEHDDNIYSFVLIKKGSDLQRVQQTSKMLSGVEYVNTIQLAQQALQDQRVNGAILLATAYVLIGMMLLLYYRKITVLLLLLIPLSSTVLTLFLLSFLGQAITVFHVMALFLVLGLGMDYIIFAREMLEHSDITQQAILLSAITSLLSFGLLAFSSMPIVQAFGSTVLIGNSINLIATIALFSPPQTHKKVA